MLGFFRKRTTMQEGQPENWSFLGADMHAHFLPGIDDGPSTMEESLALLSRMKEAGFSKVVTTPHISMDFYPDTGSGIEAGLFSLRNAANEQGIGITIEAAAEYMIDEAFLEKLHSGEKLFAISGKYVLIEMGFVQISPMLAQAIFEIQAAGYVPVLAHPERYNYFQDMHISELVSLKTAGCLFQLNTIALSGYYGKHVKILAEKLLNAGLYDFAGSDIHHERHLRALHTVLASPNAKILAKYPFLNNTL